jgi:hypothetical protein
MSKFLDHADTLRTRLITAPATGEPATPVDLTALEVIVDRQKNILTEVSKAVAKAGGTAIVILWTGFQTVDKNARRPRLGNSYTITVWSKPVIAGNDLAADDVMESVILRLWQWVPDGGHSQGEVQIRDGGLVPDNKFLKYDLDVVIPTTH